MLPERDILKETKNDQSCAPQLQVGLEDHIKYLYKSQTDFAL